MKAKKTSNRWLAGAIASIVLLGSGYATAQQLKEILTVEHQRTKIAQVSQVKIDKMANRTSDMLDKYRDVLKQIETLRTYNAQVERLIRAQRKEMASLNRQIDSVTVIDRQVSPLMLRMVDALDNFVALDVPFLKEERTNRIEVLRAMMDRANVANSEKFRRLMEAYQIENDYGRTIEAYRGELDQNGTSRTVDFLRIGRIVFLYQTLDRAETGMWDQKARKWVALSDSYRNPVRQGIRMALKQIAPDLLKLPVPAPEIAQ